MRFRVVIGQVCSQVYAQSFRNMNEKIYKLHKNWFLN